MTNMILQLILLAAGFVLLIKGADFFVKGASYLARRFGVPQIVIGLTIVALGTSAPEAAVSIDAALTGNADITIGNVLGSNIINILVILGVTALIAPVVVEKSTIRFDMPIVIGITLVLLFFGMTGQSVDRWEGAILMAIFVAYMVRLFYDTKDSREKEELENDERRPIRSQGNVWTYILGVVGMAMIVGGSKVTVSAATAIALDLGVSQRMIGLTIVALGTSLPELVTSAIAAWRGNSGIAVGNIVGSNIFNILFVTGITALITPVRFIPEFLTDGIVAFAAAVLLWLLTFKNGRLGRVGGAILLAGYAAYFVFLVLI